MFQKKQTLQDAAARPEQSVSRLHTDLLVEGGRLAVVPFRAGNGVAATGELNHNSLGAVKGIMDYLNEHSKSILAVTVSQVDSADFVLRGHVTQFLSRKESRGWFSSLETRQIAIEGQIVDVKTGQIVFRFERNKKVPLKSPQAQTLGYDLGQDIGQFIFEQI